MSIQGTMRKVRGYANDLDVNDVLDLIGLEKRRSFFGYALPAMGILGLGVLIGAGVGLAFAPMPGRRLREKAEQKVNQVTDRIKHTNSDIGQQPTV